MWTMIPKDTLFVGNNSYNIYLPMWDMNIIYVGTTVMLYVLAWIIVINIY